MPLRTIDLTVKGIATREGPGIIVNRPFPTRMLDHLDPFLLLDEFKTPIKPGYQLPPNMHPHRGFQTVTYLLSGHLTHFDTMGNKGVLKPGDVQWMTAGSGIEHDGALEEEFSKKGGLMHGYQIWVNLPSKEKMCAPDYQEVPSENIPVAKFPGGSVKIVAGEAFGIKGGIATIQPTHFLDFHLEANSETIHTLPREYNALAWIYEGEASFADSTEKFGPQNMISFHHDGDGFRLKSALGAKVLVLAGKPTNEPVARYGPFVMNTMEEIQQAFEDYRSGNFLRKPAANIKERYQNAF